jgi:hypothetical protein
MNTKAYVILFSLFLAACGGGGSDSGVKESSEVAGAGGAGGEAGAGGAGGEVAAAPSYETHSTNVSGVWSGATTVIGVAAVVNVTVNQAVSDSAENPAQALTGTITVNGVDSIDVTGTKEGDAWSLSGALDGTIVSLNQTLSSAGGSSGSLSVTLGGGPQIVDNLSLAKA